MNQANSDIRKLINFLIKKRAPSYSKSRDLQVLITSHKMILINCFAACFARQIFIFSRDLLSYIFYSGLGWLLFNFGYPKSTHRMSAYSCTHSSRYILQDSCLSILTDGFQTHQVLMSSVDGIRAGNRQVTSPCLAMDLATRVRAHCLCCA